MFGDELVEILGGDQVANDNCAIVIWLVDIDYGVFVM